MAIFTVDTDGVTGDYSGLDAAINGIGDLTENDTINCQASTGVADTTVITIDVNMNGYTLTINGEGMSSTLGLDTAKYRIVTTGQGDRGAIDITASGGGEIVINELQIDSNATTHGHGIKISSGTTDVTLSKTYIRLTRAGAYFNYGLETTIVHTLKVSNCVFVIDGGTPTNANQTAIQFNNGSAVGYVYNNTFSNWYHALNEAAGTLNATNDGAVDSVSTDFNITNGSTATNSGATPTFSSGFLLASGDATWKDAGTDLSGDVNLAVTDDALGNARSGSYDIGAHEFIAVGGGIVVLRRRRS